MRRVLGGWLFATFAAAGTLGAFACSKFDGGATEVPDGSASTPDAADATPDAADATPDAADAADAAHDAQFAIACGDTVCTVMGAGPQACCYDRNKTPPDAFSCANKPDICPSAGERYFCDDPDDCTALGLQGNVCCGTLSTLDSSKYFLGTASCTAAPSCGSPSELLLCDRMQSTQCPLGSTCKVVISHPFDGGALEVFPPVTACQP